MNTKLYVIIMSFFALIYTISARFLPHYIPIYFYIQHISLFLFGSMLTYFFISLGYRRFNRYFKRKQFIYGYAVVLFGLSLYLISSLQSFIIEEFQTSSFEVCLYYNDEGVLLYNSQSEGCADFEILEETDQFIKYRAFEETDKIMSGEFLDIVSNHGYRFKVKLLVDVEIEYDDEGRVVNALVQKSQNILVYNGDEEHKIYNSIVVTIENEFTSNTFTSTQSKRVVPSQRYNYQDYETVEHHEELLEEEVITIQGVEIGNCGEQVRLYSTTNDGTEEMFGFYVNNSEPSVVFGTPTLEECDYGNKEHTYTFGEKIEYSFNSDPTATGRSERYVDKYDAVFEEKYGLPHHMASFYNPLFYSDTKKTHFVERYRYNSSVYLTYSNYYNVVKEMDYGFMVKRRSLFSGSQAVPGSLPLQVFDIWPVVNQFHIEDSFNYYHSIGGYYYDFPNSFYTRNPFVEFIKDYALEN